MEGLAWPRNAGESDHIHAVLQGSGGECVPQGVEIRVLYPRPTYAPLEQVLVCPGLIGRPVLLTEYICMAGVVAAACQGCLEKLDPLATFYGRL